jgi:hypothetical protein
VSFALGDVVPHIIIRSLHLRVREFEGRFAKRLLQQNLPIGDIALMLKNERGRQLRRPYMNAITSPIATKAFTPVTAMPR